jgi:hypothetical protein
MAQSGEAKSLTMKYLPGLRTEKTAIGWRFAVRTANVEALVLALLFSACFAVLAFGAWRLGGSSSDLRHLLALAWPLSLATLALLSCVIWQVCSSFVVEIDADNVHTLARPSRRRARVASPAILEFQPIKHEFRWYELKVFERYDRNGRVPKARWDVAMCCTDGSRMVMPMKLTSRPDAVEVADRLTRALQAVRAPAGYRA